MSTTRSLAGTGTQYVEIQLRPLAERLVHFQGAGAEVNRSYGASQTITVARTEGYDFVLWLKAQTRQLPSLHEGSDEKYIRGLARILSSGYLRLQIPGWSANRLYGISVQFWTSGPIRDLVKASLQGE